MADTPSSLAFSSAISGATGITSDTSLTGPVSIPPSAESILPSTTPSTLTTNSAPTLSSQPSSTTALPSSQETTTSASTSRLPVTTAIPTTPTSASSSTSSLSTPTPITSITSTSSTLSSNSNTPITSTSAPLLESTVSPTKSSDASTAANSSLPTTLDNSSSADVVSRRTAAIAGATTGFIAFVLIALGLVFLYRRHKLRKALESSGKKREGRALLDGEGFDDDDKNISTNMQSYSYPSHPYPTHISHPEVASTVNLMKSRTSDTGSMFREEVWPPPGFVDPMSKQNSLVDLSGIVNDVMGASSSGHTGPSDGDHRSPQPANTRTLSATSSVSSLSQYSETSEPSPSTFESRIPASSSVLSLPTSARISLNTHPRKSSPLTQASITDSKLWLTRNVRQMSPTK